MHNFFALLHVDLLSELATFPSLIFVCRYDAIRLDDFVQVSCFEELRNTQNLVVLKSEAHYKATIPIAPNLPQVYGLDHKNIA